MNSQPEQLGLSLGAVDGMWRAADHAGEEWGDQALANLRGYLLLHPPRWRFVAPQARRWSHERGLELPPNNRAWGAVFFRARRLGIIVPDGFEIYADDAMHTQAVRAWRKV